MTSADEPVQDLHKRIAQALSRTATQRGYLLRDERAYLTAAVVSVVQPALDELRAEVARLRADLERADTYIGEQALRNLGVDVSNPEPKPLRVFRVGDTAPDSSVKLRDSEGHIWETSQIPSGMWCNEFCQWVRWEGLLRDYGPLTEVPASPQVGA